MMVEIKICHNEVKTFLLSGNVGWVPRDAQSISHWSEKKKQYQLKLPFCYTLWKTCARQICRLHKVPKIDLDTPPHFKQKLFITEFSSIKLKVSKIDLDTPPHFKPVQN